MAITRTSRRRQEARRETEMFSDLLRESIDMQRRNTEQLIREIMPQSDHYKLAQRLSKDVLEDLGIEPNDLNDVLDAITEAAIDSLRFIIEGEPGAFCLARIEINGERLLAAFEERVPHFNELQNNSHFRWLHRMTQSSFGIRLIMNWRLQDSSPVLDYEEAMTIDDSGWSNLFAHEEHRFANAILQAVEEAF